MPTEPTRKPVPTVVLPDQLTFRFRDIGRSLTWNQGTGLWTVAIFARLDDDSPFPAELAISNDQARELFRGLRLPLPTAD